MASHTSQGTLRILDANANRAREGLRVLEDLARFVLNDAAHASACKQLRHELSQAMQALDAALAPTHGFAPLLRARDTAGDVGTSTTAPTELARESAASLATAEGSRVGEALRVLEETAKLFLEAQARGAATSSVCKQLRYRAYDTSKAIALALASKPAPWQPRLCVLLTSELCTHHSWQTVASEAIAGGADCLQLREKTLETAEHLARAKELVALARSSPHVRVIINDRVDVALASGAAGVHLGQTDMPAHLARELTARVGAQLLIGVSTFSREEAHAAAAGGADLCGIGPMFATTTKHKPTLAGPAALARYLADDITKHLPHLAIGGINTTNVRELQAVGVRGIAVSSVVCSAANPRLVCEELVAGAM